MSPTDHQRRRPRLASERSRVPSYVRFLICYFFLEIKFLTSNYTNRYNTFASAGSDGTVSIWDHKLKKRLRQYPRYDTAVPSIAFNCDGTKLAVGVSYTWEEGEMGAKGASRPSVHIRTCGEEVKVRYRCSSCRICAHFVSFLCSQKGGRPSDG